MSQQEHKIFSEPTEQDLKYFNKYDEKVVTGKDQRVPNPKANEFPYNCIGKLQMFDNDSRNQFLGTACLISPNLILTVAHNLFNGPQKLQLKFYQSKNGIVSTQTDQPIDVIDIRYSQKYSQKKKLQSRGQDFAICLLQKPVVLPRYIKLMYQCPEIKGKNVEIYGFPLDLADKKQKQFTLYGHAGQIASVLFKQGTEQKIPDILQYKIDTNKGQSGSPILAKFDQDWYSIGCHCGCNKEQTFNQACFFNKYKVNLIMKWIAELTVFPQIDNLEENQSQESRITITDLLGRRPIQEVMNTVRERDEEESKHIKKLEQLINEEKAKNTKYLQRIELLRNCLTQVSQLSQTGAASLENGNNPESEAES